MFNFLIFPGNYYRDIKNLKGAKIIYLYKLNDKSFGPGRKQYFADCLEFYKKWLTRKLPRTKIIIIEDIEDITDKADIYYYDPVDYKISQQLKRLKHVKLIMLETKSFITTDKEIKEYYKLNKSLNQTKFYRWQRKRFNILPDLQLSYDKENRRPLPKTDKMRKPAKFVRPAANFSEARKALKSFIKHRLNNFGDYQDAITLDGDPYLYHSGLSSPMNMGFLTPKEVIEAVLKSSRRIKINSLEGFIRQVIGWREHCRLVYTIARCELVSSNALKATKKLSPDWFSGQLKTGFRPLDIIVNKGWKNGYLHHIERLMVVGSYMLMTGVRPKDAMKWFMNMGCDAFDWNMVPNVLGMALYVLGNKNILRSKNLHGKNILRSKNLHGKNIISSYTTKPYFSSYTTKPYFSSSNYLYKMGVKRDGVWDKEWDRLYWNFLAQHKKELKMLGRYL